MRTHPLIGEKTPWMFARPGHHCGAISASSNMMFFRSKSTAYYNMDEDKGGEFYGFNEESYKVTATENPWIFTSGARGLVHAELPLTGKGQKPETYTVRLFFAAPEGDKPGQRVFDVHLQDKTVMKGLDVTAKAGGAKHALDEEFEKVAVTDRNGTRLRGGFAAWQ